MRLTVLLLVALTLALHVSGEPQRRNGRRGSSHARVHANRARGTRGGSARVMAVQAARARAQSSPRWLKCESSVKEVPRAQHVVTARVERVSSGKARIRIKQVMKGVDLPGIVVTDSCRGKCCHLRNGDIRVFLLGEPHEVEGQLVYPQAAAPLRITLRALDLISAAVKDVPHEDRAPIQEESCEQLYCAWGADCVKDEAGTAFCNCTTECTPSSTTAVVCGSDGITYPTICQLRRHACHIQQDIRINYSGPCDEPPQEEPTVEEKRGRSRSRNRSGGGGGRERSRDDTNN